MLSEREKWVKIEEMVQKVLQMEETPTMETILFLIGLQETGFSFKHFTKDQKIDLIHVGTCVALSEFGYYKIEGKDEHGWPHFGLEKIIPMASPGEQTILMKKAIIAYFES